MALSEKDLSDREFQMMQSRLEDYNKSHLLSYLMFFFFGFFGIHKFYIGKVGMGILYNVLSLLSFIAFMGFVAEPFPPASMIVPPCLLGILLLYDLFSIPSQIRKEKQKKKQRIMKQVKQEF